jgi:hypothetical protein
MCWFYYRCFGRCCGLNVLFKSMCWNVILIVTVLRGGTFKRGSAVSIDHCHPLSWNRVPYPGNGLSIKTTCAHACNPSYSGGRDQRITVQNQPGQIVHKTLSQENPWPKRADGVAQSVGPEFRPQSHKNKNKKQNNNKKLHACLSLSLSLAFFLHFYLGMMHKKVLFIINYPVFSVLL